LSWRPTRNHKNGRGYHHNRKLLKHSHDASELHGYGGQNEQKNQYAQKNQQHPLSVSAGLYRVNDPRVKPHQAQAE
jgi:hypothetical protein